MDTPLDCTPTVAPEKVQAAAQLLISVSSASKVESQHYASLVDALSTLYTAGQLDTLVPALPLLLRLKGQPYNLKRHFVMEPLFSLHPPRSIIYKAGRQISKSTSLAAQRSLYAALIPYFSSLYIAPRFEQSRRFSNNYVRPFLNESPLGQLTLNPAAEQSVLQRTFKNNAMLHFSFAFLDADRTRGIAADSVSFDEVQDIDTDFIPVITETLSASDYDLRQYAGTPKTMDNTLQALWEESSQAEWITPCPACNHDNIAAVEYDLLAMIQVQGPSCAKCGKPIDPETGHWEHRYPKLQFDFEGRHVSQVIMPMHYAINPQTGQKDKWRQLVIAKDKMDKSKLYNEKLGESCDVRVSLLTRADLINASQKLNNRLNNLKEALTYCEDYLDCTMGVDWGGGGEQGVSYTAAAVMGHNADGTMDLLYGERITDLADPGEEARRLLNYFRAFRCSLFGHDFCGAGAIRETLMLQAGMPILQIFPAAYVRATAADMVTYKPPTEYNSRFHYSVDKARSLVLICQLIKHGFIHFPNYESWKDLSEDMLALAEDRHTMAAGSDIYLVTRKANRSDDFMNAVNYAALAFWHAQQRYPQLAEKLGIRLTAEQEAELAPPPHILVQPAH